MHSQQNSRLESDLTSNPTLTFFFGNPTQKVLESDSDQIRLLFFWRATPKKDSGVGFDPNPTPRLCIKVSRNKIWSRIRVKSDSKTCSSPPQKKSGVGFGSNPTLEFHLQVAPKRIWSRIWSNYSLFRVAAPESNSRFLLGSPKKILE